MRNERKVLNTWKKKKKKEEKDCEERRNRKSKINKPAAAVNNPTREANVPRKIEG